MNKKKKYQWPREALMISCIDERIDSIRGRGELRDGPDGRGAKKKLAMAWNGEARATCSLGLVFLRWPFGWSVSVHVHVAVCEYPACGSRRGLWLMRALASGLWQRQV